MATEKTIYDVLEQEHRQVSGLLERLEKSDDEAERERLFQELASELVAHAEAEQRTLYASLKEHDETREQTLEAEQEHHVVRTLLSEMERLAGDGETFGAKLKVLKENVEHHVEEEEEELFAEAQDVLSHEDACELARQFQAEKSARMR